MIKLKNVYLSNNDDIFLERELNYEIPTKNEIAEFIQNAINEFNAGNYKKCTYKPPKIFDYGAYYDENNEFLGNEQIHITTEYCIAQRFMYIKYNGKQTNFFKKLNKIYKINSDFGVIDE